jgi:Gpi18-like mannosyltransferase
MKKIIKNKTVRQFLIWRLWLFIPLFVAIVFLPFRENSIFTTIWGYTTKYVVVESPFVFPWSNFDGVHYLAIASRGYLDEGRFLPLFPVLVRALATPFSVFWKIKPFGQLIFWSGLFLSNLFFVLSLFFLKKLLRLDYDEKLVNRVVLLLLVFPTSFFFVSIYTESLFLLLSILALYFSRKKEWAKAILFSMLLSITRLPGILILIPLVYEYCVFELEVFRKIKSSNIKVTKVVVETGKLLLQNWAKLLKFLLVPVLLIIYSVFNFYKWGDALYFVNAHASLGNSREVSSVVFPLITIYRYLKIFFIVSVKQYEFWITVLEFFSLIFATFGIIFAYLKKVRVSYLLFSIFLVLLPLLSGTLTGFPRYLLLAFPIFIGFATKIEEGQKKFVWKILIFCSLLLQAILFSLFARGWFVA